MGGEGVGRVGWYWGRGCIRARLCGALDYVDIHCVEFTFGARGILSCRASQQTG